MNTFWEGPAGTGKTSAAAQQLQAWLAAGVKPEQILVLVPQMALARPYQDLLVASTIANTAAASVLTPAGVARDGLNLFWGLVAPQVVPEWDGRYPTYLTIETAQYYMAKFVEPAIESGWFDSLSLPRPRLIAQILDSLAKSAMSNLPISEVAERLSGAWVGHSSRLLVFQKSAEIAQEFREYCLKHALLDFSLLVDLFQHHLIHQPEYVAYARQKYRYIIADNVEEQFPVALDFVDALLDDVDEALLIYDQDAGYRIFLGADPQRAHGLASKCAELRTFSTSLSQAPAMQSLSHALANVFDPSGGVPVQGLSPLEGLSAEIQPFYPQMIDWVTDQVIRLVQEGVAPGEIVILAPFLNDSLRFSIFNTLEQAGIPHTSHRPSRAIRDEPVARAALALMSFVYQAPINRKSEFSLALTTALSELDPIRAELLTQVVFRDGELNSFDGLNTTMQSRISFRLGEQYESLRQWLYTQRESAAQTPPDHFLQQLFEFLAHPPYGFHPGGGPDSEELSQNVDAGRIIAEMIDSARRFREVLSAENETIEDWTAMAVEYMALVGDGVLAATHATDQRPEEQNAVFVAPAYTFLMRNRQVDYQFWVDAGSSTWAERLEQPLTHPYVLLPDYPGNQVWTDEQETEAQERVLRRLMLGLARRCRQRLFLGFADLGEAGFEQRGALLRVFNSILQHYGEAQNGS